VRQAERTDSTSTRGAGQIRHLMGRAVAFLVAFLVAAVPGAGHAKAPLCTGRYGLDRSVLTGAAGNEILEVARGRVSLSACGATRARVRGGKRGTKIRATFANCPGVAGKARLVATIAAPRCLEVRGTFRARRSRIATSFAGGRGTLGGRLMPPAGAVADRDTADPAMQGDNDGPESAQPVPLVATVGGAAGPEDGTLRSSSGEYLFSDFYALELDGHPVAITLNIADPEQADLDLFLVDPAGDPIATPSTGTANVERVETAGYSGPALIVVATFVPNSPATSAYVLTVGQGASATAAGCDFVPGEMIVRMHDELPVVASGRIALADEDARLVAGDARSAGGGLFRLSRPAPAEPAATARAIVATASRADVLWVQPNCRRQPLRVPNDEHYGLQWHYPLIALPAAWDATTGSPEVIVAVIDSGIVTHPDLDPGRLVPGFDFIRDPSSARDGDGIDADPFDVGDLIAGSSSSFHGTHVAGTVGAATDNGIGVAGVDWRARIMPVRVLGVGGGTDYDIAQGIRFAAGLPNDSGITPAQRADIINLSLGGPGGSPVLREAVQAARAAGVTVIVAAGNENANAAGFVPAAFPEVVTVSAVDQQRAKAPYSNFGSVVDLAAPGGNTRVDLDGNGYVDGVLSPLADDSAGGYRPIYKFYQGTSMAAPHVAGVASLMQAVYREATGGARFTPEQFDAWLAAGQLTDALGPDGFSGFGLVNAAKAVAAAGAIPGSGPPAPEAVPGSLYLPADRESVEVTVRNRGSGDLEITAISVPVPWLAASPSSPLPAAAPVVVRLTASRSGLAPARYTATVAIDTSAGRVQVPLTLEVTATGEVAVGDVGHAFVLLVDPLSRQTVAQGTSSSAGSYAIAFDEPVPAGSFLVVAGTDRDNDGLVGDPGEALGVYPSVDSPAPVVVGAAGEIALDLAVAEQVVIVGGGSDARLRPAYAGYRRLR